MEHRSEKKSKVRELFDETTTEEESDSKPPAIKSGIVPSTIEFEHSHDDSNFDTTASAKLQATAKNQNEKLADYQPHPKKRVKRSAAATNTRVMRSSKKLKN